MRSALLLPLEADIISINETHLTGSDEISLEGYVWYGHNRQTIHRKAPKGSGGVGILVKNWMFDEFEIKVIDKSVEGILGLQFTCKYSDYTFVVFTSYLPPENSVWGRDASGFFAHILAQVYLCSTCDDLYICGDLNSRIGNLQDCDAELDDIPTRQNIDDTINQHGYTFREFLNDSRLCILNGRFEHEMDNFTSISTKGKAVVDYICTPHDTFKRCQSLRVITVQSLIQQHSLHQLVGDRSRPQDHSVLLCQIRAQPDIRTSDQRKIGNGTQRRKYFLNRMPPTFMTSDISKQAIVKIINMIESYRETQDNMDLIYDELCSTIIHEMNTYIPFSDCTKKLRKRFRAHKPYWNGELTALWKTAQTKERNFTRFKGKRRDRSRLLFEYKTARASFDKKLGFFERAYKRNITDEIESFTTDNPSEFWEKLNNLGPRKTNSVPMETYDINGHISKDKESVHTRWVKDFSGVYSSVPSDTFDTKFYENVCEHKRHLEDMMLDPLYVPNDFLNDSLLYSEVEQVALRAKNKKSTGIDEIPNEVLKFPVVIKALHCLFQRCFDTGVIPSVWRKAIIFPILKDSSTDKRLPLNYRGISLLSVIAKLYSAVLNNRLTLFLDAEDKLADEQNGFRKFRSCEDHIFSVCSILRNRKSTFATFIDLQKAFDFVNRDMLLYKLLANGIDGNMYNAIKAMYSDTSACMQLNKDRTDWFSVNSGVRQGDNLSPTLFALFINDLVGEIKDLGMGVDLGTERVSMLLYADDIILLADNENDMQCMLDCLNNWCKKWRLLINHKKTKVMHFRTPRTKRSDRVFSIDNKVIDYAETYKYLGIILSENIDNFSVTSSTLAQAGGRALGAVINKVHNFKDVGYKTYEKLYNSCVTPVLDYCSSVWGLRCYSQIDMVQNRAIRYFLGVHRFTPTLAINGEVGWTHCSERRLICAVRLWNRFVNMSDERLNKRIFLREIQTNGKWINEFKVALAKIEYNVNLGSITNIDIDMASSKATQYCSEHWSSRLPSSDKLRTYITFKSEYNTEPYVLMNVTKRERSVTAQFRCGTLPLRIETGRFKRPKEEIEDRLCKLCTLNCVEDETHFLFYCSLYSDLREKLINSVTVKHNQFCTWTTHEKFKLLFKDFPRQTSKYLAKAFQRRQQTLFN